MAALTSPSVTSARASTFSTLEVQSFSKIDIDTQDSYYIQNIFQDLRNIPLRYQREVHPSFREKATSIIRYGMLGAAAATCAVTSFTASFLTSMHAPNLPFINIRRSYCSASRGIASACVSPVLLALDAFGWYDSTKNKETALKRGIVTAAAAGLGLGAGIIYGIKRIKVKTEIPADNFLKQKELLLEHYKNILTTFQELETDLKDVFDALEKQFIDEHTQLIIAMENHLAGTGLNPIDSIYQEHKVLEKELKDQFALIMEVIQQKREPKHLHLRVYIPE